MLPVFLLTVVVVVVAAAAATATAAGTVDGAHLPVNSSRVVVSSWSALFSFPLQAFADAMAEPVDIPVWLPESQLASLRSRDRKLTIREAHHRDRLVQGFLRRTYVDLDLDGFKAWTRPLYERFLGNLNLSDVAHLAQQAFLRSLILGLHVVANKASDDGQLQLALSHFSILDPSEARFYTGNIHTSPGPDDDVQPELVVLTSNNETETDHGHTLPVSFDMRNSNKMPPVYDQQACGSCWAFTSTSTLQLQEIFVNNQANPGQLSEQMLVSCDTVESGCDGGNPPATFKWIAKTGGVVESSTYPYQSYSTSHVRPPGCSKANLSPKVMTTNGKVVFLPKASSTPKEIALAELAIMSAVSRGYPVTVQIAAASSCFQNYAGGLLTCKCGGAIDHVVLVVGYTPTAFIIRNQWSANWGINGYALFPRGMPGGQCQMIASGSYYLVSASLVK